MNVILKLSGPVSVRAIDTSCSLYSQRFRPNVAGMSLEEAPRFEGLARLLSKLRCKAALSQCQ